MASSSTSSSRSCFYHVFPSFSGKDVRIPLLSHLHKEMDQKLITVFKDNDDIERSHSIKPELVRAIRGSRISVVVLSKNYASSIWCLDELLEILRSTEVLGQVVIPVFYGVDPSDVRNLTGEFGMIFKETCKNITNDVINQWSAALSDVANMAGFHSAGWNNDAKMIEAIANDVLDKLNISPSKDLEEFVGMRDHMAKMKHLLRLESDEVRMVGIWGPSGIGKTIIARTLFHQLAPRFQGSLFVDRAFLYSIRETFSKANPDDYNMKLALQRKFLSEILRKKDIQLDQLGAIGERLKNQKVLLCIDDFDDQVVLDALAGNSEWFGSGSRIIVVTTDRHHLTAHGINLIYQIRLPTDNQALEIFCQAAFKLNSPPDGLMNFAREVVRLAGSLPLGLQVLGSSLRGLEKEVCLKMLSWLRRSLDGKFGKTLRVSYEGLSSKEDKAIFRFIACLIDDHILVKDIKVLFENSELDVEIGLRNLVDKSLIIIEDHYKSITMHRLLQEMGKEIVHGQSDNPGEREFLWDGNDIREVLEGNNGTSKVLGIKLNLHEIDELNVHKCAFRKMKKLRYFSLDVYFGPFQAKVHVPKSLDYISPTLRYLRWTNFPLIRMPTNFRPENLVRLEMIRSKLKKLWDRVVSLPRLRYMDLSFSRDLEEIPDLSKAVNLEELVLESCSSLVQLPSSIRNLNKLIVLNMSYCEKLKILPTCINLESLSYLNFDYCSQLRTFLDISTNISVLDLQSTSIVRVPWWIEKFSRLKYLDMNDCSNLEYVHLNCSKLTHLRRAYFFRCEALTRVYLRGYQNGVAMKVDANSASKFEHYFKWKNNLRQQHVLVFRGEEVPSYFTHRTTGISLNNIPLLHTSLSQTSFKFRVCALISTHINKIERVAVNVNCRFRGLNEVFYSLGHHCRFFTFKEEGCQLVIFDCCIDNVPLAKLTCNDAGVHPQIHADMQIHFSSHKSSLVEWGIRHMEDCSDVRGCSEDSDDDAKGNQGGSDDSDQCGGSDDSDDDAKGNQGGSDDSDQCGASDDSDDDAKGNQGGSDDSDQCGGSDDSDDDAKGNQGGSDDSDQCGGSDDSDDDAKGNQGGSDDSDQCGGSDDSDLCDKKIHILKLDVFKSGTEHCNNCGWKEDSDEGNEADQSDECDVFRGNWDTAELWFYNSYRLEVRGVRLLEDCSLEKHGGGAETIIYDGALNTTSQ